MIRTFESLRRLARGGVLSTLLLAPTVGLAQTPAPPAAAASAGASAAPSAAAKTGYTAATSVFEKADRVEALRYRHLWIAYAAIWLIVFGFMLRTWKRSEATAGELEELKRRLGKLEDTHG